MSTRVVQDILQHPGGDPIVNRPVTIQLNVPAFITGGTVEVMQRISLVTDATGLWSVALTPNAEIDPAGTYYTARATSGAIWSFVVPAGSGPVTMRSCLVADPTNSNPIVAGLPQGAPLFLAANFGITCDGVTDDTAAWNAIPVNSGDIYCAGTSRITGPVVIPNETFIHWSRRNDGWSADATSATWSKTLPAVSSITTNGTTWTVAFASPHGLSVGSAFSLSGFVPTLYNSTYLVSVVVDPQTVQIAENTQPGTITTTGTTIYCPVIVSAGLPGANVFSGGVIGGRTNAKDIPNSIACLGSSIQEKSGFFNHIADNWTKVGFAILPAITRGFQNFYYENLESYMSATVTNPTTAIASGSNGIDLNLAANGFAAGTGILNITAGDIAAKGLTAPGVLSVATSGTKVTITYTGISPGTGPSGQDRLTGCVATPGQSSILSTGGTVVRGVGVGLLIRGQDTNIGIRGHITCAVEGHAAVMEAAVVLDGVACAAIDGLHSEEAIVGALLGWRTRVAGIIITGADGGVSATIPTIDVVRICTPRDGTTTNAITCHGIIGAAGTAVNDAIHNHTHPVSSDPRMGFYHLGYGSPSSQTIMCSSPTPLGLQVTSHGMLFQLGGVHLNINPIAGVATFTDNATLDNEWGDLFTIATPKTATMPAFSVSWAMKFIMNSSASTANLTVVANTGQTVPGGSVTLVPGQAICLIFDINSNWQSSAGQAIASNIAESQVTNLITDLAAKLAAASNLSDLTNATTARTNLGLGSAATHPSTDFDAAGAAATETARATAAEALLIPLTQKGATSGVATLDSGGKIPAGQIPQLALNQVFPAASQAAMLALAANPGDVAVRSDTSSTYMLSAAPASTLGNWTLISIDAAPVTSVAGRTGAVTIAVADVTGAAPLASPALSGTPTAPTQTALDASTKVATTAYADLAVGVEKARAIAAVAPGLIPTYLAFLTTLAAAAWPVANTAIFQRFTVPVAGTYRFANFRIDVSSGNIQYGIVQLSGTGNTSYTRVATSGVIAAPTAGDQHGDLGSTALAAGEYAFFMWCDNTTLTTRFGANSGVSSSQCAASVAGLTVTGVPSSGSVVWNSTSFLGGVTIGRDV